MTLALAADIDEIAEKCKIYQQTGRRNCQNNSTPYTSTIVFLVRKDNPKQIKDWGDLVKPGRNHYPKSKTSGGNWNHLAAWAWAKHQPAGNDAKAQEFVRQIYKQTKVLDSDCTWRNHNLC